MYARRRMLARVLARALGGFCWGALWAAGLAAGVWLTAHGLHLGLLLTAGMVLAGLAWAEELTR